MAAPYTTALYGVALYGTTLYNAVAVTATAALPVEALGFATAPGFDVLFRVKINRAAPAATLAAVPTGPTV